MNFKFKLSQRLARLKATLAVSVVLALACQSDLTDPKPPYSSPRPSIVAADLTPLTAGSVVASGNDGNLPQNTLDKNLATRWSAQGDGQWIRYDLGALATVDHVDIAWYLGNTRIAYFDIQVSLDTVTWTKVFSGQSSGQTLQLDRYAFPTTTGRYVRIVGHGNSSSTWNSITEVGILGMALPALPVASVVASGNDGNLPQNTLDKNLATRWSAQGDGQWIRYDLGALATVDHLDIAWYLGNTRIAYFDIQVSLDTVTWTKVFSGQSSGQTLQLERYAFPTTTGRYVRIVGHGNSSSTWNSITEVAILSTAVPALPVPVAAVTVNPASAGLTVSATAQLTATPKDSNGTALSGRAVTWASNNPAVATVSASGSVTGVAAGSATITATSEGKSGSATITVTSVPVASVTVSPASAGVAVGATVHLTATLKDALGNPLSGRVVTWASSAPSVASVSGTGLVTGLAPGTATITATSGGQSGSATVTVNPVAGPTPLYTLGNGANYYVAPSGSDANPCTAAAPCYTMARVSQVMSPGDNAHFAAGNYTWSYSGNKVAKSGTAAAPISYVSDTKWGAKVYGTDCAPIWNDGDYVQIINFDVTGNCSEGITTNGNYSKVIGNRVHDLPGTGGYAGILGDCCSYSKTGIQIIGNVVDNIGPLGGSNTIHGIYSGGPNSVIMNNIVTRASAACIHLYHGTTREIVANNVMANCGRYGIVISADAAITTDDYTTVDNNIVVNVPGRGIYEYPSTGCHNVYNNNIVYNNAPNFDLICGTQAGTLTLTSAQFNALFVNYTGDMTGDYHLQSGAVAIDAGTLSCAAGITSCVPLLDWDGVARPVGRADDIGAYEWH